MPPNQPPRRHRCDGLPTPPGRRDFRMFAKPGGQRRRRHVEDIRRLGRRAPDRGQPLQRFRNRKPTARSEFPGTAPTRSLFAGLSLLPASRTAAVAMSQPNIKNRKNSGCRTRQTSARARADTFRLGSPARLQSAPGKDGPQASWRRVFRSRALSPPGPGSFRLPTGRIAHSFGNAGFFWRSSQSR